jgi:protein arginine kinase activator
VSCERCAARPAKLKYTELREGKSRVLWICEECALELGFGDGGGEDAAGATGDPDEDPREAVEAGAPEPDEPAPEGPPAAPPSLGKLVLGVVGGDATVPGDEYGAVRCPGCGITGAELRERTLLGCPRCYETFARPLEDLFLRMHGALDHAGRLPAGRRAAPPDTRELHRQLREAIERQDFEAAARLRNRLRRVRRRPE